MEGDRNPDTKRKFWEDSVSSDDDDLPLSKRAKRLAAKRSSSTNHRNPATNNKRKCSEDSVYSSDDDLPLSKRAKRLAAKRSSSTKDRNPAPTSKRKSSEVSEPSSDDDLQLSKRKKRFSSINGRNPATKRKGSEDSVSSDDDLRQPKRLVPERASSTTIHDIPEELLVEILCRLPCPKSVFRCKSVSKSWHSLTSDPNFIGRFLWIQRQNQTLIPGTIINQKWGDELLTTDLFEKLRSFKTEEERRLEVLATWNNLVLCKKFSLFQDDGQYYICNPRTMRSKDQLVTLPPTYQRGVVAIGFICEPYYKEEADNITDQEEEERKVIKINAEYKCKVVRILPPEDKKKLCFKFKIEDGDLLGLSATACSNSTAADGDLGYQFHVIKLVDQHRDKDEDLPCSLYHLQEHRGRLQLVQTVGNEDWFGARLFVWELEKEELEQMTLQGGGELGQKHRSLRYDIMDGVEYCRLLEALYIDREPGTFTYNEPKVFDLMVGKGSMVNVHSYSLLINGYCKHNKRLDEAVMLFEGMSHTGLVPNTIILNKYLSIGNDD
ncbi:hypothetical protein ACLB2K_026921 [Fragaria x ananassa]